jgi:hypothetical protein
MESNIIKALPSWYNGIQFRSRLEARWAYYFDLLGVKWEYEPEAFALPSGNYLPDFILDKGRAFAEVKSEGWLLRGVSGPEFPADEARMEYDCKRFSELVQHTKTSHVLLVGPPNAQGWYRIKDYVEEEMFELIDEGRCIYPERLFGLGCPNVAVGEWVQINTYSVYKNGLLWYGYGDDVSCHDYCNKAIPTALQAARLQFDLQGRARVWQS